MQGGFVKRPKIGSSTKELRLGERKKTEKWQEKGKVVVSWVKWPIDNVRLDSSAHCGVVDDVVVEEKRRK